MHFTMFALAPLGNIFPSLRFQGPADSTDLVLLHAAYASVQAAQVKPHASSRGRGIFVLRDVREPGMSSNRTDSRLFSCTLGQDLRLSFTFLRLKRFRCGFLSISVFWVLEKGTHATVPPCGFLMKHSSCTRAEA